MANQEREERRAENLIWNAAQDYSIRPEYAAFDQEGRADLYFNHIIGAVYRYYNFDRLAELFHYFQRKPNGSLYADLLWLGLENSAFGRAKADCPALIGLRECYARTFLNQRQLGTGQELMGTLKTGHYRRVLGQDAALPPYETKLLAAIEFSPELTTEEVVKQMNRVLGTFFLNRTFQELDDMGGGRVSKQGFRLPGRLREKTSSVRRIGWWDQNGGNEGHAARERRVHNPLWFSMPNTKALREYVESCFGASMFPLTKLQEIEEKLCTGNHKDCHLHFTRGGPGVEPPAGSEREEGKRLRGFVRRQRAANLAYFQAHATENEVTIHRLTEQIRNSILLRLEPDIRRTRAGRLCPERIWRGQYLHDSRLFETVTPGQMGNLMVDLLLDGSASQRDQQEKVANQGYLIAESLTRCQIPVRVSSFCAVSGCTVIQVLRDYGETGRNQNIFNYTAVGWNRDGLALRAMGYLMEQESCEHRLLLILSDASPNDDQRLPGAGFFRPGRDYGGEIGVKDVAAEVNALRKLGFWVLCIFTGSDRELPAAQKIYGRDLARIRSVSWFADTVGRLIQNRIREL